MVGAAGARCTRLAVAEFDLAGPGGRWSWHRPHKNPAAPAAAALRAKNVQRAQVYDRTLHVAGERYIEMPAPRRTDH